MISKVRKKIIHLTNKKGIIGYISSLIFFTYASIKSFSSLRLAALQAYNPTSVDILTKSINKLLVSQPEKNVFLIYTNPQGPIQNDVIEQIQLIREEHKINIYKCN